MVTRKVKLDNLVIDWVKPRVMVPRLWFCSSADVLSRIECLSFFKSFFQVLNNRFHVFFHTNSTLFYGRPTVIYQINSNAILEDNALLHSYPFSGDTTYLDIFREFSHMASHNPEKLKRRSVHFRHSFR